MIELQATQIIDVLPGADPLPLPAPPFIFIFLMFLTFVLHMVAMNLTVGGTMFQVINGFTNKPNTNKFSKFLTMFLPVSMSFTVTLGVAPLLFVQVLYGQIFFTTSVLMAWPWLVLLLLLMIAYYSLYWYYYKNQESQAARKFAPLISLVLLVSIAVLFVMNFKLFFMKDQWKEIYLTSGNMFLNFSQAQVWPSILHYLAGIVAFGGLLLVIHGWAKKKTDPSYAGWAARVGGLTFAIPTAAQFLFGTLLLMALPKDLIKAFMMGDPYASYTLFAGMALTLVAVIAMIIVAIKRVYGIVAFIGMTCATLIIATMTMVRGYVRDVMVKNLVDPTTFNVEPQWINMGLFAILLVAGLITVGWMVLKVAQGKPAEEQA